MSNIAETPKPPYYAVIFTSLRTEDSEGYYDMSGKMLVLAAQQAGFLGVEAARETLGLTVSYWSDLDSIRRWKGELDHQMAQKLGRERWYSAYKTRVCLVERDYGFGL